MAAKLLRAAIVGATTLLGKELAEELQASPGTAWDLTLLDEGDTVGQVNQTGDEVTLITELNAEAFSRLDLVFFTGSTEQTNAWWRHALGAGASLVDLTGRLEGEPNALIRAAWSSAGRAPDLTTQIVIPATPEAQILALAARLNNRFAGALLTATVLEPASQQGSAGLDEMQSQVVGLLSFQSVPKTVYDAQVAFNLQARLGDSTLSPLDNLTRGIKTHLAAITGDTAHALELQIIQAPTFHALTASVFVTLPDGVKTTAVAEALAAEAFALPISIGSETPASNQAAVESGELMIDLTPGRSGLWLWMAVDNIKLAARNAHACGLELFALRPVGGVQ